MRRDLPPASNTAVSVFTQPLRAVSLELARRSGCAHAIRREMSVRKSDDFVADIEQQFEWYVLNADWDVADRYLAAVEATCQLLGQHPRLGPRGGFTHPRR